MKIHHLNCGTGCPIGGAFVDGRSRGPLATLVGHCLLIESPAAGLILVDTGYGLEDVKHPGRRLSRVMRVILNIRLRESETARRQVEALGFQAADVRHIIVTHLDFDHAGGLEDFPFARVHVMGAELNAARGADDRATARLRYRTSQFDAVTDWRTYSPQGDTWFGLEAVRDLQGLPPEILLLPLPGHSVGHAGVAVESASGWLLHAGDAYFHHLEMRSHRRRCPPGLRAYQNIMEVDRKARLDNQARLRELSLQSGTGIRIICSHDHLEFENCRAGTPLASGARPPL